MKRAALVGWWHTRLRKVPPRASPLFPPLPRYPANRNPLSLPPCFSPPAPHSPPSRSFVTSSDASLGDDNRNLPPPLSAAGLIAKVLDVMKKRSKNAVRALKSAFKSMDETGDFKLDREDLKWGLKNLGVELNDEQFGVLFAHFDKGGDGIISLTEFLVATRGEMNEKREAVVLAAYDKLDADGSGMVNITTLTEGEAAKDFMSVWEATPDGIVTKEEFIEYYKDLSAEIESDDQFEQTLLSAWGL